METDMRYMETVTGSILTLATLALVAEMVLATL